MCGAGPSRPARRACEAWPRLGPRLSLAISTCPRCRPQPPPTSFGGTQGVRHHHGCWDLPRAGVLGECNASCCISAGNGGDLTVTGTTDRRKALRTNMERPTCRQHRIVSAGCVVYTPQQRPELGAMTVSILQVRKRDSVTPVAAYLGSG